MFKTIINNVPIMKAGGYLSAAVLDQIVNSFEPQIGIPFLDESKQRTGTVIAVRRVGDTLFADIMKPANGTPVTTENFF